VFFVVPMFTVFTTSVETGDIDTGYVLAWRWANFGDVWTKYHEQVVRSVEYSVMTTVFCLVLALPLAYFIAFKAGRWKNLLMALVVAPFFTSYLIRTLGVEDDPRRRRTVVHINELAAHHAAAVTRWVGPSSNDTSCRRPSPVFCGMI